MSISVIPGLRASDRIVVTGAAGWLGRELIVGVRNQYPSLPILAIGSRRSRIVLAGGHQYDTREWDPQEVQRWSPTLAVHLAFLTRERISTIGKSEFIHANRTISEMGLSLYSLPSLRGVMLLSSGAAVASNSRDDPYGMQKARDEELFMRAGLDLGVPTVIARAWSLTGELCTKPQDFLFFSLLSQVYSSSVVSVSSNKLVYRRYVDAGEYLNVCLASLCLSRSCVINSTGPLVEASDLAVEIMRVLRRRPSIVRPELTEEIDAYFWNQPDLELVALDLGIELSDLSTQIRRSLRSIMPPAGILDFQSNESPSI